MINLSLTCFVSVSGNMTRYDDNRNCVISKRENIKMQLLQLNIIFFFFLTQHPSIYNNSSVVILRCQRAPARGRSRPSFGLSYPTVGGYANNDGEWRLNIADGFRRLRSSARREKCARAIFEFTSRLFALSPLPPRCYNATEKKILFSRLLRRPTIKVSHS